MRSLVYLPIIGLFLGLCACSYEQAGTISDVATAPAEVGHTAPDFTLKTVDGQAKTLSRLTKDGPVVLLVLRGYPGYQCPLCTRQVGDFISNAGEFAKRGATVVMIYPGPSEELTQRADEFLAGKGLPNNFVFLTDPDYAMTNLYGLRWDAPKETAYPSTFVINKGDRVISHLHISKTHGDRTKASDILSALDAR